MVVSWKRINNNMDQIIDEFKELYEEKKFDECEEILRDIFNISSSQYGIKLDEKEDFDHVIQELLTKLKEAMQERPELDPGSRAEFEGIDKVNALFEKISESVFKTAEIRGRLREIDPTNAEYRSALEKGIEESKERIKATDDNLAFFRKVETEIFETGKGVPSLRVQPERDYNDIERVPKIEEKLNRIKALQDAIATGTLTSAQINANNKEIDKVFEEIKVLIDELRITNALDSNLIDSLSGKDVTKALSDIPTIKSELDARATTDFTTLLNNLKTAATKYGIVSLYSINFSKLDPTTQEGRKAILESYRDFDKDLIGIEMDRKVFEKEIQIYENQIHILDEEEKVLSATGLTAEEIEAEMTDSVKTMMDHDVDYYRTLVEAQMYGDKELRDRYSRCLKLFKKCIKKDNEFELRNFKGEVIQEDDENGNKIPKKGKYDTIDYDAMKVELERLIAEDPENEKLYGKDIQDIIKFLQLEEYKEKLERTSKFLAGDEYVLHECEKFKDVREADTPKEKLIAMKKHMMEDGNYVDTFHNATNDYMFNREHHRTAGKYADTMLPLKRIRDEENFPDKVKAVGHNIYAFSRWQNPLKGKTILGKGGILLLDAMNIATLPARAAIKGIGVAVSNIRYPDEDKSPNPYNGRRDARRGARVEYYREEGNNRFVARFKGWMDEMPFGTKRRKETEQKIIDRQVEEIRKNVKSNYVTGAVIDSQLELERSKEQVRENQRSRAKDARIIAEAQEIQGDIYRHPQEVDEEILKQRTLAKLALEYEDVDSSYISSTGSRDHAQNPDRNTQFNKAKRILNGVRPATIPTDVKWGRKVGAVIAADPIGRAIRSQEIKNTLTRLYTLPYLALIKGQHELVKYGTGKIKDQFLRETTEKRIVGYDHVEVQEGQHWGVVDTKPGHTVTETVNPAPRIKFGDLEYGNSASFEHTGTIGRNVSWIEQPTSANIQALSLDFVVPDNLDSATYEALARLGYKAGDRISYSIADEATKNLCMATNKSYATSYIEGMFNFDDGVTIVDAIDQYFPEKVSDAFQAILGDGAYAGDAGIDFLTDSFATSHGITSIMEKMKTWGTGWATESVNQEALEAARTIETYIGPVDIEGWIPDYVTKAIPIMENVQTSELVTDVAKQALKGTLSRVNNGLAAGSAAQSVYELLRKAIISHKETGRETFDDER